MNPMPRVSFVLPLAAGWPILPVDSRTRFFRGQEAFMQSFIVRSCTLFLCLFLSGTVFAQGVYVTRGANGPVFSDKPQSGAKEVTLKPLNVVPPMPVEPARPDPLSSGKPPGNRSVPVVEVYRHFSIVSPADNGSVLGDTSLLEVRLAVDPPLLLGEGHAFVVRINGRFVEQRFTSTEFVIPPAFWDDGYLPADSRMQVDASIVDGAGQIVIRAAPVAFHTRQRVVYPQPYPVVPVYPLPPRPHRPVKPPHKPHAPDKVPDEAPVSSGRKMK